MLFDFEEIKKKANTTKWYGTEAWYDILNAIADCEDKSSPQGEWLEKGVYANDDGEMEMVEEWQCAKCSICQRWFTTPYLYYFDIHKYCPHCGSKMKG